MEKELDSGYYDWVLTHSKTYILDKGLSENKLDKIRELSRNDSGACR